MAIRFHEDNTKHPKYNEVNRTYRKKQNKYKFWKAIQDERNDWKCEIKKNSNQDSHL